MVKISAVIITLNEEDNIGRCIDSLIDIADEIVVVDSFSTDKTEEICRSYGTKFIKNPFEGFIQQRNYAIQCAENDYILAVDADELLSDELRKEISKLKNDWKYEAYTFNRLNNYCGTWIKHSGWYPDKKLRLFNRKKGKCGGTNPHDKVIMDAGVQVSHLKGDLLHYPFSTIAEHIAQANKFSSVGAIGALGKGRKSTIFKLLVHPFWRFMRNYFFRLGFLDGLYGLVVCTITSHENFLKYAKMLELQRKNRIKKPK